MASTTSRPDDSREQLRQQWLSAANDVFERMFANAEQNQLVTFTQREGRACLLGQQLAAWLLERHVSNDPQVRPADEQPPGCPKCGHVRRLCERLGREWGQHSAQETAAYRAGTLARGYAAPPKVGAVMLDGGRYQTRAAGGGRGVTAAAWKETKVACCQTLSSRESATDPQPEPPRKFVEAAAVARLVATMKGRRSAGRSEKPAAPAPQSRSPKKKKKKQRPQVLVRTVVATTADNDAFGWQVAAEVHRRGLDRASRKACVGDGSAAVWALFALHLLASDFIAILDFVHLLTYLYAAAGAVHGKGSAAAWTRYERWLRQAWSGKVSVLLAELRVAARQVGPPAPDAADDDPRQVVADAVSYVTNNRTRMDYPRYRRLGLPIFSAPVESTIKQVNRRVKGSEKFWLSSGAEAVLQVRTAYLSQDDRAERLWAQPRPYARAVGQGRFRPAV